MISMALPYNRLKQVLMEGILPQLQWFDWIFWTTTVMETIHVSTASGYMVTTTSPVDDQSIVYMISIYCLGQGVYVIIVCCFFFCEHYTIDVVNNLISKIK